MDSDYEYADTDPTYAEDVASVHSFFTEFNEENQANHTIGFENENNTSLSNQEIIQNVNEEARLLPLSEGVPKHKFNSYFDALIDSRKPQRKSRNNDIDLRNKIDENITTLIGEMRMAAKKDRELKAEGKLPTQKLIMLNRVILELTKRDLQIAFLEHNVLDVLAEWLTPWEGILPCTHLRIHVLKILSKYCDIDQCFLQDSGIGKAVMFLMKHPEETHENRELARRIIDDWARPLHNIDMKYTKELRDERRHADMERHAKHMELVAKNIEIAKKTGVEFKTERPSYEHNDEWTPRARVPETSYKTYVVRPAWKDCSKFGGPKKAPKNRFDNIIQKLKKKKPY